jgi:nitrate/nitrite transporter NarK
MGAWRLYEAIKTWQLYALWAVFFLNTTTGLAILSEARVMAGSIGGASAALGAAFIMDISVSDAAGRLLWPALSDRIGGRGVFLAMFCLQAAAFLLMPTLAIGSLVIFCALCMVVMSCYGGGYGTISALVASYYGARGLGAVYASVFSAAAFACQLRRPGGPGTLDGLARLLLPGPLRDGGADDSRSHHRVDGRSARRSERGGLASPGRPR